MSNHQMLCLNIAWDGLTTYQQKVLGAVFLKHPHKPDEQLFLIEAAVKGKSYILDCLKEEVEEETYCQAEVSFKRRQSLRRLLSALENEPS
jgi:hypothetical protein